MTMLESEPNPRIRTSHWGWLAPILLLAPLSLGAKGCNEAVVGDECPKGAKCGGGMAGSNGTAGGENGAGTLGKTCGGFIGASCDDGQFCNFGSDAMCGAADQTGTCEERPEICNDIYSPVCGCDGMTYANECEANGAGVSVATTGTCSNQGGDSTCGGLQGLGCDSGEFCNFPPAAQCGAADQTGSCVPIPTGCTKELAPVCGCDDITYGNACMAASAGVSVAAQGECGGGGSGQICGGIQGLGCVAGEYCNFPAAAMCGAGDQTGTCAPVPEACDLIFSPVCGCDDRTYSNACAAAMAGISVASQGECEGPAGKFCGGLAGFDCGDTKEFFCNYPPEMACGIVDGGGTCEPVPQACTDDVNPVCGCDGKDYFNACQANMAGTSVKSNGACQ